MNLNRSIENISNTDTVNKSPVLNRSNSQAQDEWQMKLYKNKGKKMNLKSNL